MSELPERPNLDQLRRQARELLRAAEAGEPQAVDRLRAVSHRVTLSAAQLAIAREYGFPSWPALHAEVERRRMAAPAETPHLAGNVAAQPAALTPIRRSLGGAATITTVAGTLSMSALIIGPEQAFMQASLMPSAETERQLAGPPQAHVPVVRFLNGLLGRGRFQPYSPEFDDVLIRDDRDAAYTLLTEQMVVPRARQGQVRGPIWMRLVLDPVPPAGCRWIEFRDPGGMTTRLSPSGHPEVRVTEPVPAAGNEADRELAMLAISLIDIRLGADPDSEAFLAGRCAAALDRVAQLRDAGQLDPASDLPGQVTRLVEVLTSSQEAGGLPAAWAGMLGDSQATDGPSRQLDLRAYVPAPEGIGLQLDALVSEAARWRVHLRATPGWFVTSQDNRQRHEPLSVTARDDLGGMYASRFGGGSGGAGHDELTLTFRPRLNPRAHAMALTFTGECEQATARFSLATGQEEEAGEHDH